MRPWADRLVAEKDVIDAYEALREAFISLGVEPPELSIYAPCARCRDKDNRAEIGRGAISGENALKLALIMQGAKSHE
ncbi:hypothetical protein JBE04_24760 [Streptomyces sp. PRKS01-29]|nr:hypothetical protein [Streptomyces sabulosicollis]MBI0297585.1 hypothetical protein [Streptomyces sabulosicollis]